MQKLKLLTVLVLLVTFSSSGSAQGRWRLRIEGAIKRVEAGRMEESNFLELLDNLEPVAEENLDAAWALFQGSRFLAQRRKARGVEDEVTIALLQKAHRAADLTESPGNRANVARELVRLTLKNGRVETSRDLVVDAISRLPARDPRLAPLYSSLGQILNYLAEQDKALEALERAESEIEALEPDPAAPSSASSHQPEVNLQLKAQIWARRATIFLSFGLPDRAAGWLASAKELCESRNQKSGWTTVRAEVALLTANLHLANENYALLEEEVRRALNDPELSSATDSFRAALRVRQAVALMHRERLENSRPSGPKAETIFREVMSDPKALPNDRLTAEIRWIHTLLHRNDAEAVQPRLARLSVEAPSLRPSDLTYLRALECRFHGLTKAPRPTLAEARDALEESIHVLFEGWKRQPLRSGGWGLLRYAGIRFALGEFVRISDLVEPGGAGHERALELLLRAQSLGSLAREFESPSADLSKFRSEWLTPGEAALFVLPSSEVSHLFLVDRNRLDHVQLPSRDRLEAARLALLKNVMVPPSSDEPQTRLARIRARARDLAALLFPPEAETWIETSPRLTLVGSDLLGYLPFEVLVLRDETLLGDQKAIGYLPSVPLGFTLLERQRARRRPPSDPGNPACLVVGGSRSSSIVKDLYPHLEALSISEKNLADFRRAYAPRKVRFLLGPSATPTALFESMSGVQVLQLLAHGIHDASRELPAGLILTGSASSDGRVWSESFEGHRVPPLVFLAACGTGRGPGRLGDPFVSHLGGALFRSGAETALLPVSDLAYHPTIKLSVEVHAHLNRGLTPAEALREARKRMREDPTTRDPFYHSLVHAHGLAHHPSFDPIPNLAGIQTSETKRRKTKETPGSKSRTLGTRLGLLAATGLLGVALVGIRRRFRSRYS